jgi:hypothetical protein
MSDDMTTGSIQAGEFDALNKLHRTSPRAGGDMFKQMLASQAARRPEGHEKQLAAEDFLTGNSPLAPRAQKVTALNRDRHEAKTSLMPEDLIAAKKRPGDTHERLLQQTEKWVAQTFYGTMLKQMRQGPFKSELFDGGKGGQAFAQLQDQQLADRMAHGAGGKLVKAIVKQIDRRRAAKQEVPSGLSK